MKKISLVICFASFVLNVFAQEAVKDSVQLEDVVVTGSKFETSRKLVPLSVSQISAENIKQSGHYNVLSTLSAYVPGVFITERNILGFGVAAGGSGAINVRGVGSSPNTQVLVLIDGHPQEKNCPLFATAFQTTRKSRDTSYIWKKVQAGHD